MKKYLGLNILEWIVLLVMCIIIITYARVFWNAPCLEKYIQKHRKALNWTSYDDLMNNADNGDLIFMSGYSLGEKSVKWASNSIFSHCGLLFRETNPETNEDVLYIWEADLGQRSKDGPRVIKLEDKIKYYHGYPYFMWRKLDTLERPSTERIMKCVEKYGKYDFDDKMYSWIFSNIDFVYDIVKPTKKVFCSELVAMTLQDLNILKRDEKPASFSPGSFAEYYNKNNMIKGYNYTVRKFIDTSSEKVKRNE